MSNFFIVLIFSLLMCAISLVGAITLFWGASETFLMSFIALSSGALFGRRASWGTFFNMLPEALEHFSSKSAFFIAFLGFLMFFMMEQLFHYHHCHRSNIGCHKPLGYIVLLVDCIHMGNEFGFFRYSFGDNHLIY